MVYVSQLFLQKFFVSYPFFLDCKGAYTTFLIKVADSALKMISLIYFWVSAINI